MSMIECAPAMSSTVAKRPAAASLREPRRKSPRIAIPEVDEEVLLYAYSNLKRILCWNIDLAIKHEMTAGLKLHDKIFGKNWDDLDLSLAMSYSIVDLAEVCGEDRSSKVLSSWFGETADERQLNMEVLMLMGCDCPAFDKPYPKVLHALCAPESKSYTAKFTFTAAKQFCQDWGTLTNQPESIPCAGGFDELNRRALAIIARYQACISERGKNAVGPRKNGFLRFHPGP